MRFTPTTKRNGACEICGDESGKCRRLENTQIHLCMTFADARKGEVQNGYKCLKPDTGKGWATFKLDDSQDWSDQQHREWQAQAQARHQHQQARTEARRKRSIADQERDRLYRQLLGELTLHPEDYADLRRRGFSDLEIDLVGYKSVSNYLSLQHQYPELLPGIASGGKRLINLGAGYLCPIRNQRGLIVACQLRLRVVSADQKNRYRWLSQEEKGHVLHFFPEGGNPGGELPLAICRPQEQPKFVALAEGTGAKPNLVSLHWGAFTIGAAGGQWASSPATLKEAIETGIKESGSSCIRLYPDAGDIHNRPVALRWQRLITLLQEWGYPVLIGWWNQRSKDNPDIDELTPEQFSQVTYLKPQDFLGILTEQFPDFDSEPAPPNNKNGHTWELWKLARKFTPTHTINQQYFDFPVPEPGTLIGIKSGLGTGKTEWIKQVVNHLRHEGWIALGYRNSLLIQSAQRWGFLHLHNDSAQVLLDDPSLKVALCMDSLPHFEPYHFDGKNLILDEACSSITHLLFAKTAVGKQRSESKAKFVEALKRAKRVFVLDGLLTDREMLYLQKLIGEPRKVIKVANDYRANGKNILMLRGSVAEEKIRLNDRSPLLQLIKSSPRCAIATDSQIEAEALDNILSQQGKRVVRLDSKTSSEAWVAALLKDTVTWFSINQPDVFIFTPTAESGVDIPIENYFKHFFCLFFGTVLTNAQQQMIGRIRDTQCPTYIFCRTSAIPSEKISRAQTPEDLMKAITNAVLKDGWATLSGVSHEQAILNLSKDLLEAASGSLHFHHECQLISLQNHEEKYLRECLIEALIEAGHKVEEVFLEQVSIEDLSTEKEKVKDQNAESIFNAQTITIEEANNIDSKTGVDWPTRCKIQKAKLIDRLPGIDISDQWTVEFVRKVLYTDREFISKCELFWLLKHPDIAKKLQQSRWHSILQKRQIDLTHHRSRYQKVKTLIEAGLLKFLDSGFTWHKETPEVQQFYNFFKGSNERQDILGVRIGEQTPVAYLGMILKKLGLSTRESEVRQGRIRVYELDQAVLVAPDRAAILRTLNTRYRKFLEGTNEAMDWEVLLPDSSVTASKFEAQLGGQEMAETDIQQGVQPAHPSSDIYNKNQVEGVQDSANFHMNQWVSHNGEIIGWVSGFDANRNICITTFEKGELKIYPRSELRAVEPSINHLRATQQQEVDLELYDLGTRVRIPSSLAEGVITGLQGSSELGWEVFVLVAGQTKAYPIGDIEPIQQS